MTAAPESLFEATRLSSLERGTPQSRLFDNPQSTAKVIAKLQGKGWMIDL